jgi:F-type H+-transporting ATPase subunit b
MLISEFTVAAQIINFLILMLLLRRFLYQPILRAMTERQAKIAAQVAEAEQHRLRAEEEAQTYRRQQRELADQREALLEAARRDADALQKDLFHKARAEAARAAWFESLEAEKQKTVAELRQGVSRQIQTVSRKVIADLADADLEQRTARVLLRRLKTLSAEEREALVSAARGSQNAVIVRSAFDLSAAMQAEVIEALDQLGVQSAIHFETHPSLILGIEIIFQTYKLAWTLDAYLGTFEQRLFEQLRSDTEAVYAG